MIIDINAFLGHYPFRQLRFTTADRMVEHMDTHGIDVALVTSLHAAFYRDSHRGNEELIDQARKWPHRLLPIPTVNPKYAGWQRDLEQSVEQWSATAVTLLPEYHGYRLTDDDGQAALQRINEYGLPVVLTQRLEDRRQRHSWDQAEDLTIEMLTDVAAHYPAMRFALINWGGLDGSELLAARLRGRCLVDFARLHVVQRREVPKLIQTLGIEAVAFGSHMPFDYIGPSLVKLANLSTLPAADYDRIAWRNAADFFQLELPRPGR